MAKAPLQTSETFLLLVAAQFPAASEIICLLSRFVKVFSKATFKTKNRTTCNVYITIKETVQNGNSFYSLELKK